jgi:hypothetical protein
LTQWPKALVAVQAAAVEEAVEVVIRVGAVLSDHRVLSDLETFRIFSVRRDRMGPGVFLWTLKFCLRNSRLSENPGVDDSLQTRVP